jgi:hypothetical protein
VKLAVDADCSVFTLGSAGLPASMKNLRSRLPSASRTWGDKSFQYLALTLSLVRLWLELAWSLGCSETVIIFFDGISRLIFVMEKYCVFFEVLMCGLKSETTCCLYEPCLQRIRIILKYIITSTPKWFFFLSRFHAKNVYRFERIDVINEERAQINKQGNEGLVNVIA